MKRTEVVAPPLAVAPPAGKVEQIVTCLLEPRSLGDRPGFSGGQLGPFLFLYAYALHTGCPVAAAAAQQRLLTAVTHLLALASSPTYYRELGEFGTLLLYLREQDYLDESFDPLLAQVDVRAGHGLRLLIQQPQFDPFVGYLALAPYYLRRGDEAPLHLLADALLRDYRAQPGGETGYWYSYLFGKCQLYLGWSHGLAAILLFLTQLLATGFAYRRAELRQVLAGAARYLLLPQLATGPNHYPDIVGQARPSQTLNLCYGDLGIGFALLQAAQTLADEELRQHALRTLGQAATRRDPAQCNVFDASFIYGASGNALLFKSLQHLHPAFGTAAGYWYEQAQQLSQHPAQVAGYRGHHNRHVASAHYSLFEGLAGFGLVLLEFESSLLNALPLLGYPSCL
jgi:hypothetical protein